MYYVMGPYLVFEEKRPSFWLSWSMEKGTIQTIFVADYHNGSWQERLRKDLAEVFYVYDVSANVATDVAVFCLIFNQSKVYRIVPHISRHGLEMAITVNQVQRLQCNDKRWFYHVDPFFKAYDSTIHHTFSQSGYLINIDSFPTLHPKRLLDSIKEKYSVVGLPTSLTEKQQPVALTPSEQLLKALDLDDLAQRVNAPLCLLLTSQPNERRDNELCLWLEKNTYHYVWSLNGCLLAGEIQGDHNQPLIDALHEFSSDTPEQAIHEALKEKQLLQTLTSECFNLSLHQQKLIVVRLAFDGVWPEIDSVSDKNQLEKLFFSFIDLQKADVLPTVLKEISDSFHQFMEPKRLVSIAQQSQFGNDLKELIC